MKNQGSTSAFSREKPSLWTKMASFWIPLVTITACLLAISSKGLLDLTLGGLDEAHHVMDGVFFRDFYTDLPLSRLKDYVFEYYQQYPALGFIFWPPFFPAVEGVILKLGGVNLLSAQISILLFGLLLALCCYQILRRSNDRILSTAGTAILIATPGLYPYFNVVMLEIPVLAMMALTLLIYLNTTNKSTIKNWQFLAIAAALSLYTKQTAFIMMPAIAFDLLLNHRRLLKTAAPWLAVGTATILTLPLAIFTLKFGKANIEQSIGSGTQLIMSNYAGPSRWALESWLYYPKTLLETFHLAIFIGLLLCLYLCISQKEFRRKNAVYIAWIAGFYFVFSYFDNKSSRFTTLIAIPATILAVNALSQAVSLKKSLNTLGAHIVAGIFLIAAFASTYGNDVIRMQGLNEVMSAIDISSADGNVIYFGNYRQPFVYHIRERDHQRSHYVLQGDDIFNSAESSEQLLRDFRVRYIMVEPDNLTTTDSNSVGTINATTGVEQVFSGAFHANGTPQRIVVYRNNNALAEKMRPIQLSSALVEGN